MTSRTFVHLDLNRQEAIRVATTLMQVLTDASVKVVSVIVQCADIEGLSDLLVEKEKL